MYISMTEHRDVILTGEFFEDVEREWDISLWRVQLSHVQQVLETTHRHRQIDIETHTDIDRQTDRQMTTADINSPKFCIFGKRIFSEKEFFRQLKNWGIAPLLLPPCHDARVICSRDLTFQNLLHWKFVSSLWPMTLVFCGFYAVVKIHVHVKFHQAACSGSRVIMVTEKKTLMKTIQSVATARTVITKDAHTHNLTTPIQNWKPGLGASYAIRPGNRVGLFYTPGPTRERNK